MLIDAHVVKAKWKPKPSSSGLKCPFEHININRCNFVEPINFFFDQHNDIHILRAHTFLYSLSVFYILKLAVVFVAVATCKLLKGR